MDIGLTKILDQISKFQIKSITDSLFKYGLYLLALSVLASIFSNVVWVTIALFAVGAVFEFMGLIFYVYFAKRNPDYLRSENFQIRKQSIEILGDKNNHFNPNAPNITFIASHSPYSPKELNSNNDTTEQ